MYLSKQVVFHVIIIYTFEKLWLKVVFNFYVGGKVAIYVVLGLLVLAFLFFVINTIRCYLTRPKFDDED